MSDQNKAIIRRLVAEVLNRGRFAVLGELCAPELALAAKLWITPVRESSPTCTWRSPT